MIEPLYVAAREVLLDALDALGDQREALILAGAQAIYIHTGVYNMAFQMALLLYIVKFSKVLSRSEVASEWPKTNRMVALD